MTNNGILQILFYLLTLTISAKLLGIYIARVFEKKPCGLDFLCHGTEKFIYRFSRIDPNDEMDWKTYTVSVLLFNLIGILILYLLQRLQGNLPFNLQNLTAIKPDLAFNTAISFVTNTNWMALSGKEHLSFLTKMFGLTTQNFLSAATGLSVLMALIRGLTRKEAKGIGNFWSDLVRSVLYILLPLSIILSLLLVSQGVIQNFHPPKKAQLLQPFSYEIAKEPNAKSIIKEQTIPTGPAASQIAIKHLGSNGGGFFATNSAHPLENPTPISNFLEMFAILLIPASLCFAFGAMVQDKKQGRAIFIIMVSLFVVCVILAILAEQSGNHLINSLANIAPGGNMEGKETRFGNTVSAFFTTIMSASSNGSVNSSLDSYTPLGSLIPLLLMQLGEIVFGGVGAGLYGMLIFVILTVFIAGLMVGRTPEYLGKKIEIFEIKMASLAILMPHLLILGFTGIAIATNSGRSMIGNPGIHGFTEILYAFTSAVSNNGSSFAGLKASSPFYNILTGLAMLFGRYWGVISVLAIAGSLARKKIVPISKGTMPTHTPLFISLVISVILIIGILAFFPALALGPIAEHLLMIGLS